MLEPLTLDHLERVIEIEQSCFSSSWSEAQLRSAIGNPRYHNYACVSEGLIGFAFFAVVLDEAELLQIAICPTRQNRGWASQFLNEALSALGEQNVKRVFLEVRDSNLAARTLYRKQGFIEEGHRNAYYPPMPGQQQREDAILLSYSLPE